MITLKLAVRTLAKSPFVTIVAVVSLALGIGANSAIFSLFDQLLLRGLPVEEPTRLVNLSAPGPKNGSNSCNQAGSCEDVFSYPMFRDLERSGVGFAGLAAHRVFGANLALDGQPISAEGMLVSGRYFEVLGLTPALGRLLGPADDETTGAHPVAVLSHSYWANDLGSDRSVLDRSIVANGQTLTVVGVAPPGFEGTTVGSRPRLFVPIAMTGVMIPGWDDFENRRSYFFYVFGRLRGDGSLEQARAEIKALYSSIINEVEVPLQEDMTPEAMERFKAKQILVEVSPRGQSSINREARTPLILLLTITGFVLLIACANIANLLLARGATRAQEIAVRSAIGGSRGQLIRQLLTESLMLAALGGVASMFVASWTLQAIGSLMPPQAAQSVSLSIDPRLALFAAALAMGTGLLFGLYPALHWTRPDLIAALRVSSAQPSASRSAQRYRSALVTAQFALSMALLVGAGLFIRSLVAVARVDLGIETDDIVTFGISPELSGYDAERSSALFQETEEALAAIPGVTAVSAALVPVLGGSSWGTSVSVEGYAWEPGVDSESRHNQVGPGYFATLGIPLLAGREFADTDVRGAPRVAVVNEAFTRKFNLEGRAAVGKRMAANQSDADELDIEIVGVVQDAKYNDVKEPVPPLFFLPYRQSRGIGFLTFYTKTGVDPNQVILAVPDVVGALDHNLPIENVKTLERQIQENVFLDRLIGTLSSAFALLATLLAAVGLYGVLAFTVAQRTREIGVRMALGAGSGRVGRMVLGQVGRVVLVGGVLGVVAAYYLGRAAQSLLFEVQGLDPFVFVGVALLLAGVAFSAGYLPARRASRVDPMVALRSE
ncbi:MAG: ABC transporter permease [Gemmatimonadetes bacterium]|nr:ABC transporter permease [Gemmatimonadota bacterium]